MALKYKLIQSKNAKSKTFGKWYARAVVNETIDINGLAEHMSLHNTPFSKGTIKGILTDMVSCVHELSLKGTAVKIDDLAIFSVGIVSKGAVKPSEFTVQENVAGYKLRARATGQFIKKELSLVGRISEQDDYHVEKESAGTSAGSTGGESGNAEAQP
jgi:predicted histone-like DNA-binding protein